MSTDLRQLSEREREILQLVSSGLSNQQIARELGISANTVKVHLRNVFAKIGAASRTEATMYAVRAGLVAVETLDQDAGAAQPDSLAVAEPPAELSAAPTGNGAALETPAPDTFAPGQPPAIDGQHEAAPAPSQRPVASALQSRKALAVVFAAIVLIAGLVWASGMLSRVTSVGSAPGTEAAQADPNVQRWRQRTKLSSPRAGFATASFDNFVYVIGGEGTAGVVDVIERYDLRSETWTGLSKKPTPATDIKAVRIGGKIYVPGGRRSGAPGDIVAAFEAYDPATDTWEQLPNLPAPRSGYGLATVEGKLYLFGGWDGRAYRAEVLQYDPATRTWTNLTPMPTARAYLDVVVVEGSMYVLGGQNQRGALSTNEQYVPSAEGSRPWITRAPLPAPRSHFGAAVALNLVHVLGGVQRDAAPLQYNVRTDSWQPFTPPPERVGSQPGVIQQDVTIISLGGQPDANAYSASVQEYQALYTLPVMVPGQ